MIYKGSAWPLLPHPAELRRGGVKQSLPPDGFTRRATNPSVRSSLPKGLTMDISEDVKGPYASSPADIRATAENIAENYSFDPSILAGAICAALVSERERCAKVCEAVGSDLDPQYADHIAFAIRSGETGK